MLSLCCVASLLSAAVEPQVADLRLVLESRPTDFAFTWSDPRSGGSGKDAFDSAWASGVGLRWGFGSAGRPLQLLAGIAGLVIDESQPDLDHTAGMVRTEAGWCYGLDMRWLLTATAELGLSHGTSRLRTGAGPDLRLTGTGWEIGTMAGIRFNLDRRWSIGLETGWVSARDQLTGDGTQLDLQRQGIITSLAFAWTLDPQPRPLGGR